jgi:hypothetical protein
MRNTSLASLFRQRTVLSTPTRNELSIAVSYSSSIEFTYLPLHLLQPLQLDTQFSRKDRTNRLLLLLRWVARGCCGCCCFAFASTALIPNSFDM